MRDRVQHDDLIYRRRWIILLVLCISLVVIVLDNTILNVALPRLSETKADGGLGASQSQLQWIVDSYTIVFAGLLLTAGSTGDRFGRYKFLAIGLVVFGFGSVLSALAPSANALIAARSLMGVGGAFIMPATLSILTNVFTDPAERAKAIGIWAGVSALGLGIGPISGGVLLSHFWWGSIFLVNVPVVVAGLVLGFFFIPDSRDPDQPRQDPVGALLSIAGLAILLAAVIEAPDHGWTSPEIVGGFVLGAAVLAGFMFWEIHSRHPMLNLNFFRNPRFSAASGAITLTFFALFGMIFLLTQYLQLVLGFSTVKAGAVLLPQAVVILIAAPLSSVWVEKLGNKVVVATGMAIVAIALGSFVVLDERSSMVPVIGLTMLLGLGMGNVIAPATDSIMGSLPRAKAGVGSAVNDTTRQTGGAVGVAVLGSLLSSRYAPQLTARLTGKVPPDLLDQLTGSIGATLNATERAPSQVRAVVVPAARASFVSGMHLAALVGAAVVVVAAAAIARWLPARAPEESDDSDDSGRRRDTIANGRTNAVPGRPVGAADVGSLGT